MQRVGLAKRGGSLSAILKNAIPERFVCLASGCAKPNSKELKSREVFRLSAEHALSETTTANGQGLRCIAQAQLA